MIFSSLICVAVSVTCFYLLQQKRLAGILQQQAVKTAAWLALGFGILLSVVRFGFWAGSFSLLTMLMTVAVIMPFVFWHRFFRQEPY